MPGGGPKLSGRESGGAMGTGDAVQVLTIASGKGGTAKTSTCLALAAIFAESGDRVLVVDADAQGSASAWLGVVGAGDGPTLIDVLAGSATLDQVARPSAWPGIDVVPSSPALAAADRTLAGQHMAVLGLRSALAAAGGRWRWCLVDCPPNLGLTTAAAVAAATGILATTEASALGLGGLGDLADLVAGIGAHVQPRPRIVGILACRVDSRQRLACAMLDSLRARWGDLVLPGVIRETVRLREAAAAREAITRYDPGGPGALDYRQAALDIEQRMQHGKDA